MAHFARYRTVVRMFGLSPGEFRRFSIVLARRIYVALAVAGMVLAISTMLHGEPFVRTVAAAGIGGCGVLAAIWYRQRERALSLPSEQHEAKLG